MPKPGKRVTLEGTLVALMALLVLGGLIALGFLQDLPKENRALIVIGRQFWHPELFCGLDRPKPIPEMVAPTNLVEGNACLE